VLDEVSKQRDIFYPIYKKIRNKIFAHTDIKTLGLEHELFSKTNIDEIQNMFETLHAVRVFIHQLFYSGRKYDLKDLKKSHEETICEDIKKLFTTLKSVSI
jgi:hypothetical protein